MTFSRKPWEKVSGGALRPGSRQGGPGGQDCSASVRAKRAPPCYMIAFLSLTCLMWTHIPQMPARVMGKGQCLVQHYVHHTVCGASLLATEPRFSATTRVKEQVGYLLSRHFVKTLCSLWQD